MSSAFEGYAPARLWSLDEIMREFDAASYCHVSALVNGMIVSIDNKKTPSPDEMMNAISPIYAHAVQMRMPLLERQIKRIAEHFQNDKPTVASVYAMLLDLRNRLVDSLAERKFLALSEYDAYFYEPPEPLFGAEVQAKFPSIIYDIEESGKCTALGRFTASAFHSIRCLEAGITALSRSLGIPDPTKGSQRSWGTLLQNIKGEIDKKWPANTGRMSGDAQAFDEMYGALSGMQNPYRNSTMHLAATYSADEAKHIFEVVKGFMARLASRMDQDGLPKA